MTQAEIRSIIVRFPQLSLPVAEGESETEEYRCAARRGEPAGTTPPFCDPGSILLEQASTPAGTVEILYLAERQDFLRTYRALAYRCEPAGIPDAVGACILDGLADWSRIRRHREEYEGAGGSDWSMEFRRFTAIKENFRIALILLSAGVYSAVPAEKVGIDPVQWKQKSVIIRKYHELCHFVCRKKWPDKKEALRDEVYADFVGLMAAFGDYDPHIARLFLGVEGDGFREGGRLAQYVDGDITGEARRARMLIDELDAKLRAGCMCPGPDIWDVLAKVY